MTPRMVNQCPGNVQRKGCLPGSSGAVNARTAEPCGCKRRLAARMPGTAGTKCFCIPAAPKAFTPAIKASSALGRISTKLWGMVEPFSKRKSTALPEFTSKCVVSSFTMLGITRMVIFSRPGGIFRCVLFCARGGLLLSGEGDHRAEVERDGEEGGSHGNGVLVGSGRGMMLTWASQLVGQVSLNGNLPIQGSSCTNEEECLFPSDTILKSSVSSNFVA